MALMHHPVTNKNEEVIHSAVTNLDIHDMSRASMTYGVERFYVVTPLEDQKVLARRIMDHWVTGPGGAYNPIRRRALSLAAVVDDLEQAAREVEDLTGHKPLIVATGAKPQANTMGYGALRERLKGPRPVILVFGTAWGLTKQFIASADIVLDPIQGVADYNHLSVRSAASIILDRLLGR